MNKTDFDALVAETLKVTTDLLVAKGEEYAGDADRLANFKRNALRNGQTVLETWMAYWNKHIDSIHTYMARTKDEATYLALQETVESFKALEEVLPLPSARSISDRARMRSALSPATFRCRINNAFPDAMRTIDGQLSEPIEGRFHDNINYSFLCLALIKEIRELSK